MVFFFRLGVLDVVGVVDEVGVLGVLGVLGVADVVVLGEPAFGAAPSSVFISDVFMEASNDSVAV